MNYSYFRVHYDCFSEKKNFNPHFLKTPFARFSILRFQPTLYIFLECTYPVFLFDIIIFFLW